jgi:hypothetical protein
MEHPSGRIGDTEGEFSVCQFFENDTYEYVRRWVSLEEAVNAAKHYCTSVAAKIGIVRRVIITDGGDSTNFMWEYGKGITYKGE